MTATSSNRRLTVEAKGDPETVEEQRKIIYEWSEQQKKYQGLRKSYQRFLVYTFKLGTIISFIGNINFMVLIQMCLAGAAVYVFTTFDITFEAHVALFLSPIIFPLAFSINTDFQRREKVLDDLANFKSASMVWYFCMRDWKEAAGLDDQFLNTCHKKLNSMLYYLREYLFSERCDERRAALLRAIYEDFSDVNQLIEQVRASKLPANTALMSRAIHLLNTMCLSFERLRNVREYRSPRSIRSFNKVLIFVLPFILAPYFVFLGKKIDNHWSPYYIAIMASFIFGCLQGVQDKLDDPFDGMSEDDVNLKSIDEWTFDSLGVTVNRNFKTGRFQVSANIEASTLEAKSHVSPMMVPGASRESQKLSRPENFIGKDFKNSFERLDSPNISKTTELPNKKKIKKREKSSLKKKIRRKDASQTPPLDMCKGSRNQHPFRNILEKIQGDVAIERNGQVFSSYGSMSVSETPNSALEWKDPFSDPIVGKNQTAIDKPVETAIDMQNLSPTTVKLADKLSNHVDQQKKVSFQDEEESFKNENHADLDNIHSEFTSEASLSSLPLITPLIKPSKNTKKSYRFKLTHAGGHQHVTSSSSNSEDSLNSGSEGEKKIKRQSNSALHLKKEKFSVLANSHVSEKNLMQKSSENAIFFVPGQRSEDNVFI